MIIGKNTSPNKKVYYLGALVIEVLSDTNKAKNDFLSLFEKTNEKEKISINLFSITLDWLYLLNLIKVENGKITKCF